MCCGLGVELFLCKYQLGDWSSFFCIETYFLLPRFGQLCRVFCSFADVDERC